MSESQTRRFFVYPIAFIFIGLMAQRTFLSSLVPGMPFYALYQQGMTILPHLPFMTPRIMFFVILILIGYVYGAISYFHAHQAGLIMGSVIFLFKIAIAVALFPMSLYILLVDMILTVSKMVRLSRYV